MNSNEFYKLKYQKYKNKYISLKNKNVLEQKGGIADKPGKYYFYVSIDSVTYKSSYEQKWNNTHTKSWWEQKYNLKHNDKNITSEKELKNISFCFYCFEGNDCDKKINFREPCDKLSEQQKNSYSVVLPTEFETLFPVVAQGWIRKPTNANLIKKYFIIEVNVNKYLSNEILSIRYVVEPWASAVPVAKKTEDAYLPIFTPPKI